MNFEQTWANVPYTVEISLLFWCYFLFYPNWIKTNKNFAQMDKRGRAKIRSVRREKYLSPMSQLKEAPAEVALLAPVGLSIAV